MPTASLNQAERRPDCQQLRARIARLRRRIDRRLDRLAEGVRWIDVARRGAVSSPADKWVRGMAAGMLLASLFSSRADAGRISARLWKMLRIVSGASLWQKWFGSRAADDEQAASDNPQGGEEIDA